jgi:hypothetical protein
MLQVDAGEAPQRACRCKPVQGRPSEWSESSSSLSCWWACSQTQRALIVPAKMQRFARSGRLDRWYLRSPLAHQPDFVARQMAVVGTDRTVAQPHMGYGELGRERALRALPPRHAPPGQRGQNRLGLPRILTWHGVARSLARLRHPHAGIVDFLVPGDPDRPGQSARVEAMPEHGARCLIPGFDGAGFPRAWKDALWARFSTGAPR